MTGPASSRLPYAFARANGVVDVCAAPGGATRLAFRKDGDVLGILEARRALGGQIEIEQIEANIFEQRLAQAYASGGLALEESDNLALPGGLADLIDHMPAVADLLDARDDAPIIRLINGVIAEAARLGASDIHIEPYDTHLAVRMRIDGMLAENARLNPRLGPLIVSRVKVMARLDIAERRLPQDGRISLAIGGRSLDVRVSTLPARGGERVVLRLLDRDRVGLALDELGMPVSVADAFRSSLREPNGMVLVTGPTGSGKTTTLYAALRLLNDRTRNILTIEDPVEYAVEGVGQTQVNAKVGLTFASGLRAILRQDPNVVMVGEIRDAETAQIAVQSSLTGHLVLSSVHTNDAAGAVTRLRDLGVEPFLLASTLRAIVAQRLVRRLCPACRQPHVLDDASARLTGLPLGARIWRSAGCAACTNTGYQGRIGVYELIRIDDGLRRLIASGADEDQLAAHAFANADRLRDAALHLAASGSTTIEEALRVARTEGSHA